MARRTSTPRIAHSVNGFSRYDIPENVAFTASAGILYPVRVDFLNPRDCRYIQCGATVRTNPAVVPTFSPYRIRLHRFFCPMSLYHPEMRVNSSNFDYRNLSTNLLHTLEVPFGTYQSAAAQYSEFDHHSPRSLVAFLGLVSGSTSDVAPVGAGASPNVDGSPELDSVPTLGSYWVNADPVLCYYDIVRNYYGYSQVDDISFAVPNLNPGSKEAFAYGLILPRAGAFKDNRLEAASRIQPNFLSTSPVSYWPQYVGSLKAFDTFFETSFYPVKGRTSTYFDLTGEIYSMFLNSLGANVNPGNNTVRDYSLTEIYNTYITGSNTRNPGISYHYSLWGLITDRLPFGVAPSMADRFSRTIDNYNSLAADINIEGVATVRQLAIAAKTQAYADLLSAGGSRFTDFIKTFFAANVSHVDRPVLVYSSSFFLNSNPIFNQSGTGTLGAYGGIIDGNSAFGKRQQRYCFNEPGYLIDILSIQPLYYWSGIQNDYARYDKLDYFNPIFNEVGYQTLPYSTLGIHNKTGHQVFAKEPCYNEFRASYDRVLGDMALIPDVSAAHQPSVIYSAWVQQRSPAFNTQEVDFGMYARSLRFVDVAQSNSCFASTLEDNFFVNLYYNVSSKSLVSKNFATNLSTR